MTCSLLAGFPTVPSPRRWRDPWPLALLLAVVLICCAIVAGAVAPEFLTLGVSNTTPTTAALRGLVVTGATNSVRHYWGLVDGTTNASTWGHSTTSATQLAGVTWTNTISGLLSGTTYYARVYGTNTDGAAWATNTVSFSTPANQPTGSTAIATVHVTVDTNGVLRTPTNFATANGLAGTGSVASALSVALAASNAAAVAQATATWTVWADAATNYYATAASGAAYTNANFAAMMADVLGQCDIGAVIELGASRLENGTLAPFLLNAPVVVNKLVTIRGQGNYGTSVKPASGYTGALFEVGLTNYLDGIVHFDRLRLQSTVTSNLNYWIDAAPAELKVTDCEVFGYGGGIRLRALLGVSHWNQLHRNWFVCHDSSAHAVDLVATNGYLMQDALVSDSHFTGTSNGALRVVGSVNGVIFKGNRVMNSASASSAVGVDVSATGSAYVVAGNAFVTDTGVGWPAGSSLVRFAPPSSNNYRAVVSGNALGRSGGCLVAVEMSADTHGVAVAGNQFGAAAVTNLGANVGGYINGPDGSVDDEWLDAYPYVGSSSEAASWAAYSGMLQFAGTAANIAYWRTADNPDGRTNLHVRLYVRCSGLVTNAPTGDAVFDMSTYSVGSNGVYYVAGTTRMTNTVPLAASNHVSVLDGYLIETNLPGSVRVPGRIARPLLGTLTNNAHILHRMIYRWE